MSPSLLRFDREEERSAKRREEIRQRAEERWDLDSHLSLHRLEMSATVFISITQEPLSLHLTPNRSLLCHSSLDQTLLVIYRIFTRTHEVTGTCLEVTVCFPLPCCSVFSVTTLLHQVIIWSSAEFVGLLAFKEMNSLSFLMLITTVIYFISSELGSNLRPSAHLRVESYSVSVVGGIAFQHIPVGLGYNCPKTEQLIIPQQKSSLYVWESSNWCPSSLSKSTSQRRSSGFLCCRPRTPIGLSKLGSCFMVMCS